MILQIFGIYSMHVMARNEAISAQDCQRNVCKEVTLQSGDRRPCAYGFSAAYRRACFGADRKRPARNVCFMDSLLTHA